MKVYLGDRADLRDALRNTMLRHVRCSISGMVVDSIVEPLRVNFKTHIVDSCFCRSHQKTA